MLSCFLTSSLHSQTTWVQRELGTQKFTSSEHSLCDQIRARGMGLLLLCLNVQRATRLTSFSRVFYRQCCTKENALPVPDSGSLLDKGSFEQPCFKNAVNLFRGVFLTFILILQSIKYNPWKGWSLLWLLSQNFMCETQVKPKVEELCVLPFVGMVVIVGQWDLWLEQIPLFQSLSYFH